MNEIVKVEYGNICAFILDKYKIDISKNSHLENFTKQSVELFCALKIWEKYIDKDEKIFSGAKYYFSEIISNTIHCTILAALDLNIPALIMLRRSQENILTFLYYSEHEIEYYKKEIDDNTKNFNGFKELKDYIISYPYTSKNKINAQNMRKFSETIIIEWANQYRELSKYVHSSNKSYFGEIQFFDEIQFDEKDVKNLTIQISKFGSIVNTLLIVFLFDRYKTFVDDTEKSLIRGCIKNEYKFKEKIVEIFKEI